MATITKTIQDGAHDGHQFAGGSHNTNDMVIGVTSGFEAVAALWWDDWAIPQGREIASATLDISVDNRNGTAQVAADLHDSDDAAVATDANRPDSFDLTGNPAAFSITGTGAKEVTGLGTAVQAIVNRAGWTSGSAMQVVIVNNGATGTNNANLYDRDQGTVSPAQLTVVVKPTIAIDTPADESEHTQGDSISFSATASDITDGDISGDVTWESDLDGALGAGKSGDFSTTGLSVGEHTITATIEASDGSSNTAQITITVAAPVSDNASSLSNYHTTNIL